MRGRITKENNGRVNLIAENWRDDKKDQKNNWGGEEEIETKNV